MKTQDALAALAALAQDSRLAVYRLLVKRGPEGYPAGELAERLGIPAPTLSFHLKALAQAGLVASRREGRHVRYAASLARMDALVAFLTDHCCSLASGPVPGCAPARGARGDSRPPNRSRSAR